MTPVPSIVGTIAENDWLRHDWRRRGVAAVMILVLFILAIFPTQYRTSTTFLTADASSMGLGGVVAQTSAFNSVFGNQAAIELALKVARGQAARKIAIDRLGLVKNGRFSSYDAADRWLAGAVGIRSMRGGILQMDIKTGDPEYGIEVLNAMTIATKVTLTQFGRLQTAQKKQILRGMLDGASARLAAARATYNEYRLGSGYTAPQASLSSIGARVPGIRNELKAKEMELRTAQTFATDDNLSVRQIKVQIGLLQQQLREALSNNGAEPYSVDRVVRDSTKVLALEREVSLAQQEYDTDKLYMRGISTEEMIANLNLRILEPPFVDTARQFRIIPTVLAILILLLAISAEFYLLRPPISSVRARSLQDS